MSEEKDTIEQIKSLKIENERLKKRAEELENKLILMVAQQDGFSTLFADILKKMGRGI